MSRLVVVSNRVGDLRNPVQAGGLAVAVTDALRKQGGLWFGWDGERTPTHAAPTKAPTPVAVEEIGNVTQIVASLTEQDYQDYYVGYANSLLWPLFHYRLDLVDYRQAFFKGYLRVNSAFASALYPFLRRNDLIWVHDYHLIPFARYLRKLGCRQRIGFFLHIPFPPPEIVTGSPNHAAIVAALLEYDVIGFQTTTDVSNFRRYVVERGLAPLATDGAFLVDGRTVLTERFPIGIDVDSFREMSRHAPEDVRIDQMRRGILGRKQIIGVDRLDYSKGIPARFQAFEKLMVEHPELEKAVSLLQIAPPTREAISAYAEIRAELEGLSGAINGRFAEFDWTPIRYIHRAVPRDKLASIFRSSQVCMVTPLRDGMNLVAKEYVAAQDEENPGVLVLSQFAGAAEEMAEALIVNPHDIDEMARSLYRALTMPLLERRERHAALLERIRHYDVLAWAESFLALLADEPRSDTASGAFAQPSAA